MDILYILTRLALKVDETQLQLFSLQQSRSPPLCLDLMQLTLSTVVLRQRRVTFEQERHLVENTWHAENARSTAEENCSLRIQQTRKTVVEERTEKQTKKLIRSVKVVGHAEILEIGEFLVCQKQRKNAQHTLRRN